MVQFVLIGAGLVAVAVAWLAIPLLRARPAAAIDRGAVNAGILKDQLAELERERASGAVSEAAYAEARGELERRALEELPASTVSAHSAGSRRVAVVVALSVPLAALALYAAYGERSAFDPEVTQAKTPQELIQLLAAGEPGIVLDKVTPQLKRDPNNGELLFILARAHYARQQFSESAAVYEKLNAIEPDDPGLLTDWADVIAQSQRGSMLGRPEALINRALAIDPDNGKTLAMSGAAAFERQDYATAAAQWEKLRARVAGTELAPQIEQSIAQARAAGKLQAAPAAKKSAAATVSGRVVLAPKMAKNAAPNDTVFVIARAAAGPRTPLAVVRLRAGNLPAKFSLDDSLAMSPELKLSAFSEVTLLVRLSKSGNAVAQAGDLEAAPLTVKLGARDVVLVIDRVRQ